MKERVMAYLATQMSQTSTWRGLILVLTAFGATLSEDQKMAIVITGIFIAGVVAAAFPDSVKKEDPQ